MTPKHYDLNQNGGAVGKLLQIRPELNSLYLLEKEISPILSTMEEIGLLISNEWFSEGLQGRRDQLVQISNEINQIIGSAKRRRVDDEKLHEFWNTNNLPVANSFDALRRYKDLHPSYRLTMKYKNHQSYLKMWDEKLKEKGTLIDDDILIKGSWHSFSSYTGRITVRNLPLTSIPIAIRDYVVSPRGYQTYSLDLNNAELRFLAHYAKCNSLLEQFHKGIDVHAETAKLIRKSFGSHDINEDQSRKLAKQFAYSLLYGAGKRTIAKNMRKTFYDVTSADVDALTDAFYQKYPELLRFLLDRGEDEKLLTPFGKIKPLAEFTETQRKNFAMQSSVSAAIKILLTVLAKNGIEIVHVIHDEVWILVPVETGIDNFITNSIKNFKEKMNEVFSGLPMEGLLMREKIGGN